MVLYSNSKEVERMQEYDQVGYILSDLGMDWYIRAFKAFEGYAYQRAPANQTASFKNNNTAATASWDNTGTWSVLKQSAASGPPVVAAFNFWGLPVVGSTIGKGPSW